MRTSVTLLPTRDCDQANEQPQQRQYKRRTRLPQQQPVKLEAAQRRCNSEWRALGRRRLVGQNGRQRREASFVADTSSSRQTTESPQGIGQLPDSSKYPGQPSRHCRTAAGRAYEPESREPSVRTRPPQSRYRLTNFAISEGLYTRRQPQTPTQAPQPDYGYKARRRDREDSTQLSQVLFEPFRLQG